jgi:hypothetical protein
MWMIERAKATSRTLKTLKEQRQMTEMMKDRQKQKMRLDQLEETTQGVMRNFNTVYNKMKRREP